MVATQITADVRRHNASQVLRALLTPAPDEGKWSRRALRDATGLVSGSITTIVELLIANGLVRETGETTSGRGRPQRLLVTEAGRIIAPIVSIAPLGDGHCLETRLVDLSGDVIWQGRVDVGAGADEIATSAARAFDDLFERAQLVSGAHLVDGVMSVPGAVAGDRVLVASLPLGVRNVDLIAAVTERMTHPQRFQVRNEGRLGALAEFAALDPAIAEPTTMVYVASNRRGLSGGIIDKGAVFGGEHGHAGEVGHIVVDCRGAECECGAAGCLNLVLGLPNLCRAAGWSTAGSDDDVAHLVDLLRGGDERALRALSDASSGLAAAISTMSNYTDASVVVLGGYLLELEEWLRPSVDAMLARRASVSPTFNPTVRVASHHGDAAWRGGALVAREAVLADPLAVPELLDD